MTEIRETFVGVSADEANQRAETARRHYINTGERTAFYLPEGHTWMDQIIQRRAKDKPVFESVIVPLPVQVESIPSEVEA